MSLEAAPISPVERAQNDLQRVIDRYTTPDSVSLRIADGETSPVTLDPTKGDQGFSYMAKRAYLTKTDYSEKQALKAALLLSKEFMTVTGDPKLQVRPGDILVIGMEKAILTRKEKDKSTGKTVTKTYEVIVGDGVREINMNTPTKKETERQLYDLKNSVAGQALLAFAGNSHAVRSALSLTGIEGSGVVTTTTLSPFENPKYPNYQFITIAVATENPDGKKNFVTWEIGVNNEGKYLILDREAGRQAASASNLIGIERSLSILMAQKKENWKAGKSSVAKFTTAEGIPVVEATPPPFQSLIQDTLYNHGFTGIILTPHKVVSGVDLQSFTVTATNNQGALVEFFVARNSSGEYQLADRWGLQKNWIPQSNFMDALNNRLSA
ncbi:MAG: hypothetical protein WCW30_03885 [Candidatus Gracilibacteria bacterium]